MSTALPGLTLQDAIGSSDTGASANSNTNSTRYTFDEHYILQQRLSKGSFGTVFVTQHRSTGQEFAVKVVDRQRLQSSKDDDAVFREVSILQDCRSVPHIVQLIDFYVTPTHFHVIQVYAQGGDVFERLAKRNTYNEQEARRLAVYLIQAMDVLHARKLAHRDLKPENLLLSSAEDDAGILVADFGFAAYVPQSSSSSSSSDPSTTTPTNGETNGSVGGLKTRCGTPAFVAPEVLEPNCRYDERVDMWSVGCLLYMLLGGYPPFQDKTHRGLFRKIRGADFCFHEAYFKNVSVSAKQLIASLLTVDPNYRCTAAMALKSNWLKMTEEVLRDNDLSSSLAEIKRFQAKRKLKGAMHAVAWSVKAKFRTSEDAFPNQIAQWDKDDEARERVNQALDVALAARPSLMFSDVYELTDQIHASKGTSVWGCTHKVRKEGFAVKIIERQRKIIQTQPPPQDGQKNMAESVLHEVGVLHALNHKNIIKIIDFFEDDHKFYLVMERMDGGDVFDRIVERKQYTEKDARDLAKILLEAVYYLHSQGIAHRDLKPQNLLLKSRDDDSDIKVADFGFACRVHTPQSLTTRCGTPTYVAPEILKNIPYDQSADMWSVGIILYVLLCGYPPIADDDQSMLFQKIRTGEWTFVGDAWKNVSDDAKEVIKHLLVVDPLRRWTAKEVLQSKWLAQDDQKLIQADLTQSLETMKQRKSRLVTLAKTIMWMKGKGDSSDEMKAVQEVLTRPEVPAVKGTFA